MGHAQTGTTNTSNLVKQYVSGLDINLDYDIPVYAIVDYTLG
ncbi:MAG TPA: hypothetical protein VMA54_19755 [Steroidobacteraceae bacterium]|nr:hypothetical protein [Steroidobacteraceae bacterium]